MGLRGCVRVSRDRGGGLGARCVSVSVWVGEDIVGMVCREMRMGMRMGRERGREAVELKGKARI